MTLDQRAPDAPADPVRRQVPGSSGFNSLARAVDATLVASVLLLVAVIPIEVIATFGPLSLSRVVAVGCSGLLALSVLMGQRLVSPTYTTVVAIGLLAWASLSYFWSYDPLQTLLYASRLIQLGLLLLIVWQVIDTPRRLRLALQALACGGLAGSLYSAADRVAAHGGVARYSVGDPNDFGVALSITLMATLYLCGTTRAWRYRVLYVAITVLQMFALIRTASRTAVLATVIGALFLVPPRAFLRPRVLAGLAAAAAAAVGIGAQFATLPALARIGSVFTAVQTGDFNDRGPKWTLALQYFGQSPVGGVGGGAFRTKSAEYGSGGTVAHSVWLGLLSELGIVGFLLFASLVVIGIVNLVRHLHDGAARAVLAMEVCWLVGTLTLTLETRKVSWLLIALATCRGLRPASLDPASREEACATSVDVAR